MYKNKKNNVMLDHRLNFPDTLFSILVSIIQTKNPRILVLILDLQIPKTTKQHSYSISKKTFTF